MAAINYRESIIEGHLVRRVKQYGGLAIKMQKRRGWPDRIVLWEGGLTHWIELKRPKGGRYEPLQLRVHQLIRRMGHTCIVLNTKEAVDEYVAQYAPRP